LGSVLTGIYGGIKIGANDVKTDFEMTVGIPHKSIPEMMEAFED